MANYLVKKTEGNGSVTYYTCGHSTVRKGIKSISKYYTYEKERGAKMLAKKLSRLCNDVDTTFEVVECKDEGIEVN